MTFERELFTTEPEWLEGDRNLGFGDPGAFHAAMVLAAGASVLAGQGGTGVLVEDFRLHEPLVLPSGEEGHDGRAVQVMIKPAGGSGPRGVTVFSRGGDEESWMLHAEGQVSERIGAPDSVTDLEEVKERLGAVGVAAFYGNLDASDVTRGSSIRTVESLWTGPGEAIGEVALANEESETGLDSLPGQLDGCFQVVGAAAGGQGSEYSLLGCDRLWVWGALPERVVCHARVRDLAAQGDAARELPTADLRLYDAGGVELGGANGLAVRRAAPAALVAAKAVGKLLYKVTWRERPHEGGIRTASFLAGPRDALEATGEFEGYLAAEATDLGSLRALQEDLETLARGYALAGLEQLGWRREKGARADPGKLRRHLKVVADQERLFGRLFEMLAEAGALEEAPGAGWTVVAGAADPLPVGIADDPDGFAEEAGRRQPQGRIELQLLARCGAGLPDVLRGRADPVALLFSREGTGAADFYGRVPALRAANSMTADVVASLAADLPEGRRLRVLEVGAGTASSTAALLEALPSGRFDYAFTDVSAGFFAAAEARFGQDHPNVEYRVLDIESDPTEQGFEMHRYDLVVAANVLHATRDLSESLGHCRELLAPSGELVLLEGLRRRGWLDLTFGLLDGWWRFEDRYRKDYALLEEAAWRAALADAGFGEVAVWGGTRDGEVTEHGLIVARAPAEVVEPPGTWVLAAPHGGGEEVPELAAALVGKNQTVVVASDDGNVQDSAVGAGIIAARVDSERREAWRALLDGLSGQAPLRGVVHLGGLGDPAGPVEGTGLAEDTRRANASALALAQGLLDSAAQPANGLWFLTRGAQVVEREIGAHLAAAALWGLGRTLALEAPQLRSRLVDLDPGEGCLPAVTVDEFLYPDRETQVAHRRGQRFAPRLVRNSRGEETDLGLRDDGTYLVTGGLGGIGRLVAGWLADHGARRIVLNGRRPPDAGMEAEIETLREGGVAVRVELADVADAGAVERLVERLASEPSPLVGVVHCAGAVADAALSNQTWERFEAALAAKMLGAWNLHRATEELDLDLFLLFSSVAGVLGSPGQANHAAANAFLDQLARHRRATGLSGQSIAWGPWSSLGEAEERRAGLAGRLASAGIGWIEPQQGLQALGLLVRQETTTNLVAPVDWAALVTPDASPPILEELLPQKTEGAARTAASARRLVDELRRVPLAERQALLVTHLRQELQTVLRLASPPDAKAGFFDLGMDSLMAVELRNRLSRALDSDQLLSSTAIFDYPDPEGLAQHLAEQVGGAESAVESLEPETSDRSVSGPAEEERKRVGDLALEDFLAEAGAVLDDEFPEDDD